MLKEMVSTADSSQIIEQNKNLTKMYEECKKMTSTTTTTTIANGNMPRLRTSLSPPKHSVQQQQQQHQRCGDIFNLIDAFKSKIENEFSYLKGQAKTLEDRLKSSQPNATSFLKEIEQFRQVVQSTQATFDREKYFLFKDLNSQKHLNPIIVANIQNDLERNLNEKYLEFSNLIKKFYSSVPSTTSSNSATCTTRVITTINRSSSFNHNRTVDSSFLTEEEEAIKKISEKIKFIKAKISSKAPKVSKRVKTPKSHLNESSSDDTDTKELAHLNEQIRQIKSKMILKGDQLSKMKKNSNDEFIEKSRQKTCTGPIYLPINHLSRRSKTANTSGGGGEVFKIMPANFCSQSYNDEEEEEEDFQMEKSRTNFFRSGAATATTVSSTNVASKFYLVRKSGEENKKEFSVSPERKYMSSVEIPAEQLEALKGNYF